MLLTVQPVSFLNEFFVVDEKGDAESTHPTGGFIMDQERRRIEELRRRAADEGKAMWEAERRLREANCKSFNSIESEDSSVSSSCDTPSEKETTCLRLNSTEKFWFQ